VLAATGAAVAQIWTLAVMRLKTRKNEFAGTRCNTPGLKKGLKRYICNKLITTKKSLLRVW